jgi:hypothetical protein
MARIFYFLPFVLRSEDLFNACSFFRSSCSEFSFMDGVVREVLRDPKREPKNEDERLAFEKVVLQSFRTIEAIVGEPAGTTRSSDIVLKTGESSTTNESASLLEGARRLGIGSAGFKRHAILPQHMARGGARIRSSFMKRWRPSTSLI